MIEKPKFFFESDETAPKELTLTSQEHADTFFSTLQGAGIIQESPHEDMEEKKIAADASMQKKESKVLVLEYGTYQDNYAIHLTPIHPRKNLENEQDVKQALYYLASILNEYVPHETQVNLFLPRADWKMKVISAVVQNGAHVWNFDKKRLEENGIPRIFEAVERVIMA
jgi:hypothetical protein